MNQAKKKLSIKKFQFFTLFSLNKRPRYKLKPFYMRVNFFNIVIFFQLNQKKNL